MVRTLDGTVFSRVLRAGALAVVREQEALDRMNVFPVRDADTGANLAATLKAAASRLGSVAPDGVGAAARAAADGALDGARGNSGAIFAQFLHGLAGGMDRQRERRRGAVRRRSRARHRVRLHGAARAARGHHPLGAAGLVRGAALADRRRGLHRDDAPRARGGAGGARQHPAPARGACAQPRGGRRRARLRLLPRRHRRVAARRAGDRLGARRGAGPRAAAVLGGARRDRRSLSLLHRGAACGARRRHSSRATP